MNQKLLPKKIIGYKNNIDYFDRTNNSGGAKHTLSLNQFTDEQLIKQIQNFKENYIPQHYNKTIPKSLFIPKIPVAYVNQLAGLEYGSKRKGRKTKY